jgi:hypothetical protein
MTSSVETIFASSDGGVLYELTSIAPSRILCVTGASEESVVQHSSTRSLSGSQVITVFLSSLTYDRSQGRKLSFNHIESNPNLSHSLTVDIISSNLCPSWLCRNHDYNKQIRHSVHIVGYASEGQFPILSTN